MFQEQVIAHLVEVDHDVAFGSPTAHHALQHQSEEEAPGLGHVEVIGVVLVPVLNGCNHLVVIRADYLEVLNKPKPLVWIKHNFYSSHLNTTQTTCVCVFMCSHFWHYEPQNAHSPSNVGPCFQCEAILLDPLNLKDIYGFRHCFKVVVGLGFWLWLG